MGAHGGSKEHWPGLGPFQSDEISKLRSTKLRKNFPFLETGADAKSGNRADSAIDIQALQRPGVYALSKLVDHTVAPLWRTSPHGAC